MLGLKNQPRRLGGVGSAGYSDLASKETGNTAKTDLPNHVTTMDHLLEEEERDLDDEMDEGEDSYSEGQHRLHGNSNGNGSRYDDDGRNVDDDDDEEYEEEEEEEHHCNFCDAIFRTLSHLKLHIETEHRAKKLHPFWICPHCGAIYDQDVEDYKQHLVKVHKVHKEVFTLDNCDQNPVLGALMSLPDTVETCPECDVRFDTPNNLQLHLVRRHKTHTGLLASSSSSSEVVCPLCQSHVPDLNEHGRQAHGLDGGVMCPHCGKALSKTCTLNRHIEQVHMNLQIHKPAKCDQCGRVFSKKGHLDRHVRTIHMGIKESSEPCPHCGKVFSTKSSLEPHIEMVHRGVRKKCRLCGKELSDLCKHMRTVHGEFRRKAKIPKDDVATATATNTPTKEEQQQQVLSEPKNGGRKSSRKGVPVRIGQVEDEDSEVEEDGYEVKNEVSYLKEEAEETMLTQSVKITRLKGRKS